MEESTNVILMYLSGKSAMKFSESWCFDHDAQSFLSHRLTDNEDVMYVGILSQDLAEKFIYYVRCKHKLKKDSEDKPTYDQILLDFVEFNELEGIL